MWLFCRFEVITLISFYFLVFLDFHFIKVILLQISWSAFHPKIRGDAIDIKQMNLKTNKSFVFSFWQKNGVLLTKISMFYKEWSVKNSLLTLVGMSMVFHVYMVIACIYKNLNLIKMGRFFTANRSTKYTFMKQKCILYS